MTKQQKDDVFLFLQKFCSDNAGHRLNEWIIESFLNRAYVMLEKMSNEPNQTTIETNGR